jgi:hypothetical protein
MPYGPYYRVLSEEERERYRRMTVAERFQLTAELTEKHFAKVLRARPQLRDRWFELIRRENDDFNRALCEGLARAEGRTQDA